jgi:transcription initiation factor TFIIB
MISNEYIELFKDLTDSHEKEVKDNDVEFKCPLCNKESLTIENGSPVCTECGTEAETSCNIDCSAEWRNDDGKTEQNRCGGVNNMLLYESSFSTKISVHYYSSYLYKNINRLQTWQMMPSKERSLKDVFDKIFHQGNMSGVPMSIIQHAQILFKTVVDEQIKNGKNKICRGDKRDGLIAACLFYSCSIHKVNRSKKEIAQIFEIDETDVTRGCKLFFKLMNNKICLTNNIMTHEDFIDRFCSNLGLDANITDVVHKIADKAYNLGIVQNNTPPTIATGCIFFVSTIYSLNLSKKLISQQCGISQVTITKTYNKLINYMSDLL